MLDSRGNPITVGARVAYNLSGDVAYGEVMRVSTVVRILALSGYYAGRGHVSTVRNPRSVMVLRAENAE